jgi:hypothetical protein
MTNWAPEVCPINDIQLGHFFLINGNLFKELEHKLPSDGFLNKYTHQFIGHCHIGWKSSTFRIFSEAEAHVILQQHLTTEINNDQQLQSYLVELMVSRLVQMGSSFFSLSKQQNKYKHFKLPSLHFLSFLCNQ